MKVCGLFKKKNNRLSFDAVSQDFLTLEGSCLVQKSWKILLQTAAQPQVHPAPCAPVDLVTLTLKVVQLLTE